jgi:hypothetical protein
LIVLSLIVGIVLTALGLSPFDIVASIERLIRNIYATGFDAIRWAWRYFLLGAVIVFPVWLVMRLVRSNRNTPSA